MNRRASKFCDINPMMPEIKEYCKIQFEDGKNVSLPVVLGTDGSKFIDIRNLN